MSALRGKATGGTFALLFMIGVVLGHAASDEAEAADSVTMRMDWLPISYHAPFHLAKARGYYDDAGIDVKFEDGRGSGAAIQLVANGVDTFGFADASVVAKTVSEGVPIKLVMGVFRRSAVALVLPAGKSINQPEDLKGKKLATCAGDAAVILLPAYLRAINLSEDDVEIVTVDCGAKYTVVAQGNADVTIGFGPYGKTQFKNAGIVDVRIFDYADAGINIPSHGIIAATRTIEEKPDLVQRFVAASQKGWNDARQDPDAAIEELVRSAPLFKGKEGLLKEEFVGYLDYTATERTKDKPFGWQSPEDWDIAQKILVEYLGIEPQPVEAYFTNRFVTQ